MWRGQHLRVNTCIARRLEIAEENVRRDPSRGPLPARRRTTVNRSAKQVSGKNHSYEVVRRRLLLHGVREVADEVIMRAMRPALAWSRGDDVGSRKCPDACLLPPPAIPTSEIKSQSFTLRSQKERFDEWMRVRLALLVS